jgi:hypothetical protein
MPHNLLYCLLLLLLFWLVHLCLKDEVASSDLIFITFPHRLFLCFHFYFHLNLLNFQGKVHHNLLKVTFLNLLFTTLLLNQIYNLFLDNRYLLSFYQYHLLKPFFYTNFKVKLIQEVLVYLKFQELISNLVHIDTHQLK